MRSLVRHMQGLFTRHLPHPNSRRITAPGLRGGKGLKPPTTRFDLTQFPLDDRITFTRNSGGTYWNEKGEMMLAATNAPRPYRMPSGGPILGLMIEETSTNLFINSKIDKTNLATQSITLIAAIYTLSFYGDGEVAISGGHTATINGISDTEQRQYQFTPTAGSTTFTITGSVFWAQIEQKGYTTSYIPTGASAVTRESDIPIIQGTSFTSWYNNAEGTVAAKFMAPVIAGYNAGVWIFDDGVTQNEKQYVYGGVFGSFNGNVAQASLNSQAGMTPGVPHTVAIGYAADNFALSRDGQTPLVDLSGIVPASGVNNRLWFGPNISGLKPINGYVASLDYWNTRLSNDIIKGLSAR